MRALRASLTTPALFAGAALFNAFAALTLVQVNPVAGIVVGLAPVIGLFAAFMLTSAGRLALLGAALTLPLFFAASGEPLPVGGANIFAQDLIVGLALGGWATGTLIGRRKGMHVAVPYTAVCGWPLALLGATLAIATVRGHFAYGASLLGQPLRLVLYAGIVVTLAGLTAKQLHRLLLWTFYGGTVITLMWAIYYIATGTSQVPTDDLSTGGARVIAISTSSFCAGTFFLALLSLRLETRGLQRLLHFAMAGISLTLVVLGFGRAVFAAVFLSCLVLLAGMRSLRRSLWSVVPLAAPFVVLLAILVPSVAPDLITSFEKRVSVSPGQDANVQWRIKANEAILEQVREQPLYGVGFGRLSHFFLDVETPEGYRVPIRIEIGQDPHNGYLYLLAGGGLVTLAAFLLVLATYVVDAIRRSLRTDDGVERLIVLWSGLALFPILLNAATGTEFESPPSLLYLWALLVLPAVVVVRSRVRGSRARSDLT